MTINDANVLLKAPTKTFYADCESWILRPGQFAPKLVCLQYAIGDYAQPAIVLRDHGAGDIFHTVLRDPNLLIEGHNFAGFDLPVLARAYPDLLPDIFRALGAGRGRDTMVRETLIEIARGTLQDRHPKGHFSLGAIAERRCGIVLDKGEDSYRLKYALLDGIPPDQWPVEARQYALDDVTSLRAVSKAQLASSPASPDEWFQVAAAFVLQLAAVWGLRTDPVAHAEVTNRLTLRRDECARLLESAGFFRDGSVNKKAVQAAVEDACRRSNRPTPRTEPTKLYPAGQTKTDAETIETVAPHSEPLKALVTHGAAVKNLSTFLAPMVLGLTTAMNSRPNVLVATGRTSWGGSKLTRTNPWWPEGDYEKVVDTVGLNLQNVAREPGIRDCLVPRPGYYFCSVDYSTLELRTLGQACLWIVGKSTFARGYQADPDWDPHSYLGGVLVGIDYAEAIERKKTDKTFKNGPRKIAKALNFSLGGGVGAKRFAEMSLPLYEAGELPEPISVQQAYKYKELWLDANPEMRDYFEWVSYLVESQTPYKQFVSGRVRGGIGYTDGCNQAFQGTGADVAKRALFAVSQACYVEPGSPLFGSRVVAFVHDEIFAEVPIATAHEAAFEIVRLMNRSFSEVCPDVPPASEPALMTRWTKAAEPKFENGRLIPWA